MPSLPKLSGRDVVRAFARDGWQIARHRGSHIILVKEGLPLSYLRVLCELVVKFFSWSYRLAEGRKDHKSQTAD